MDDVCPVAKAGLTSTPTTSHLRSYVAPRSLEEHYDELGTVLTLAEAILFSEESMVQCTKAEASKRTNLERYRPITHLQGAGAGAWLWNSLTAAANGKNALERLERAHCLAPVGSHMMVAGLQTQFSTKSKAGSTAKPRSSCWGSKRRTGGPCADRVLPRKLRGRERKELSTWCVGVASTAIEEAT